MVSVNLKTIWVLSLLLLVIILLSAIKICPRRKLVLKDLYVDPPSKERFSNPAEAAQLDENDYRSLKDLIKHHRHHVISKAVDQDRQDHDLAYLEKGIEKVEKMLANVSNLDN